MLLADALTWIKGTNGKIFSIKFIKRTTGEMREMVARLGVKSHLRGGEPAYDAEEKNLIVVFDMAKNGYRSIPIENIKGIKIDGKWKRITKEIK